MRLLKRRIEKLEDAMRRGDRYDPLRAQLEQEAIRVARDELLWYEAQHGVLTPCFADMEDDPQAALSEEEQMAWFKGQLIQAGLW